MITKGISIVRVFALLIAGACPMWAHAVGEATELTQMSQLQLKGTQVPTLGDVSTDSLQQPAAVTVASGYSFATTTTASLVDMSSGTTTLIAADQDDTASAVTLIGFDFYFQGVRQDRFSVNSNGSLRFGATAISTTLYDPLGQAAQFLITAYGADQRTHAGNGKVHFKLLGTAPNRVLVVEWLNEQADFNAGGTADLTYQVHLFETSGEIEFAYGAMNMSANGAADANSLSPQFGFSSSNAVGTVGSITAAQSGTPAPTFNSGSATPVNNTYVAGTIPALTSAVDGSRRNFTLTPAVVNPPGGPLTFTAVSATGMTLNWTDSPNELGYAIYISTDGTNFSFFNTAAQNATSFVATGLLGAVTYSWQVYAVNEGSTAFISGTQATTAPNPVISLSSGLWSNPTTWSSGAVPTSNDAVTISSSTTVTVDTAASAYSITVAATGVLQFEQTTARTLTVATDVTVQSGGTLQSNPAGTQTGHTLSITGNLTNNGTLDFSTNADTAGAILSFNGLSNATFGGSGATTDIRQITVTKGTSSTSVLELNPSNFTVRGVTTDTVVGGWLVMANGTLKISGTFAGTSRVFAAAAYTIPASFGLWLNNPNYTIAAQNGNAVVNGTLRVSQGTFNQGTLNTATMTGGAGAVYTIEGGTLNLAGRFNPATAVIYNQSGGSVNLATVGNSGSGATNGTFTLATTASFNMTGGAINLVQASTGATPIDFINSAAVVASNGTLQTGTAATATNFNFRVRGNLPNLVIDNTTNNKTATATAQVNLLGTTLIKTGATFVINGQVCLVIGPTFTNNGTLTGTAASTRFYFLGGNGATTYNGNGVVTAPLTSFEVDNIAGVTIDPAVNAVATVRFNNFSGGLTGSGKLALGNGGATTAVVQLGVAGVSQTINGFDVPPVFNAGTGGVNLLYAPELVGRTTGNEMPPSRTLNLLSITDTNNVTIAGGDVTVNGTVAGSLALGTPRLITGSNTVFFNSTAGTVTRTTGYVDGNFKKSFAAAASVTYEVGSANGYTPVVVNATAGTFPTDVTVSSIQASAPGIPVPTKALTRYWNVTSAGVTSADLTFNYLDPADIPVTLTEANLVLFRKDATSYTNLGGTVNTAANNLSQTGISTLGLFTLAEPVTNTDLSVTKDDGVTSVNVGANLTYTIVASNAGPSSVTGATVTDTLPTGLTCNWACTGSGGGTCSATGSGNISDLINLPVGASSTYTLSCTVGSGAGATLANTASIVAPAGITDTNSSNDSATDTDAVARDTDLSITNTDGVTTVNTGDALTYTIVAANAGPIGVTGAAVTDVFPSDLTCNWTCTGSGGGSCLASGTGDINDLVNLPVGGSATYSAVCSVATVSVNSSISTTATIAVPAGLTDTASGNNSATDTDSLVRLVDLSITKSDGVTSVIPGNGDVYNIVVGNAGPNATSTITTDNLPAGLTACTWTCSASAGSSCTSSGAGSIADLGSLASGGTLNYVLSCTVSASATGALTNTATVSPNGVLISDTNSANNSATDNDMLTPQSDVAVAITDHREFVRVGDSLNYIITVTNSGGPSTAVASVTDTLPAELDAGSWICIPFGGATCANGYGDVLSDTATLPPGAEAAYVYTAVVLSEDAAGMVVNSASATAAGDSNTANDSATDTPSDIVVIFKDDFEGLPLTVVTAIDPVDSITAKLHANPALLNLLGLQPVEVLRGESTSGQTLFAIELARFNHDAMLRVITRDAIGVSQIGEWRHTDLVQADLTLSWQSSAVGQHDGSLVISGAIAPIQVYGVVGSKLGRLIYTTEQNQPWLSEIDP